MFDMSRNPILVQLMSELFPIRHVFTVVDRFPRARLVYSSCRWVLGSFLRDFLFIDSKEMFLFGAHFHLQEQGYFWNFLYVQLSCLIVRIFNVWTPKFKYIFFFFFSFLFAIVSLAFFFFYNVISLTYSLNLTIFVVKIKLGISVVRLSLPKLLNVSFDVETYASIS